MRRRSRHRFTTVTAAVKCHDLHLLDSRSCSRRFVQCARQSARARVVDRERNLGAEPGAEQRRLEALGLRLADYSKCRQATSKHLLQRLCSANVHCVASHTHMCVLAHTHMCVPCPHIRVLPRTHMSVFSHTHRHMCVSECSSEASFCRSVQKRRNLRVDTSPTVLNRMSLHHLSSSTCLKAFRSLPRKKKFTVFFSAPWAWKHCARNRGNLRVATSPTVLNRISLHHLSSSIRLKASRRLPRKKNFGLYFWSRAGAEAVQNHTFHQILNCSARAPDRISLHRLSSSVHLKASRSALWLTVFSRQLAFFDCAFPTVKI